MSGNRCMMKLISGSNLSKQKELLLWEEINQVQFLNPIPTGLWNDVNHWGGPYLGQGKRGSMSKHP